MSSITLTASMRSNLQSLKTIALQMGKTQNILSTGMRVNSAIDNATSYYQARRLTNRAADLNNLLDAMGQGIQTIQAATEGLNNATTLLEQAIVVANQALMLNEIEVSETEDVIFMPKDVPYKYQLTYLQSSGTQYIDTGFSTAEYNGNFGYKLDYQVAGNYNSASVLTCKVNNSTRYGNLFHTGGKAQVYVGTGQQGIMPNFSETEINHVEFSVNNDIKQYTITNNGETLVKNFTGSTLGSGLNYTLFAGNNAGQIKEFGSFRVYKLQFFDSNNQLVKDLIPVVDMNDNVCMYDNVSGTFLYNSGTGDFIAGEIIPMEEPVIVIKKELKGKAAEYQNQLNSILNEYTNLLNDCKYNGINLLKGNDLNISLSETNNCKFRIKGKDFSTTSIGLEYADWTSKNDIEKSIRELANTINEIEKFQSELGNNYNIIQTRSSFTEAFCDILETGADNLLLADMNEASAEYLMLQTRQQLATNSLSLAAQSAQSVLSLF